MRINIKKYLLASLLVLIGSSPIALPASAYYGYNGYNPYYGGGTAPYYNPYSVFTRHPILSGTVVGGAVGAAGGAAVGAFAPSEQGQGRVGRDALIGTGAGAALGTVVGIYRNVQIHRYYY